MARVIIDVSALALDWFQEALKDMSNSKTVVFVYTEQEKYAEELRRSPKLLQFIKLMMQKGRVDVADSDKCDAHVNYISSLTPWLTNSHCCDDPHLFAMVYEKPTGFIFSNDARLAKCRGCLRNSINRRYLGFSAIRTKNSYDRLRHQIHK